MCRSQRDSRPFSSGTWSKYFPSGEIRAKKTWPLLVRFSIDICSTGRTLLRGRKEYTPNAAATSSRRMAPSTRPVPNLFLLAAAMRMELLEGARGGGVGVAAGVDACVGMRAGEEGTGAILPAA